MELFVSARISPKLRGLLVEEPADYRKELFSVGGNALAEGLKRYIRRQADLRHDTARRLGARRLRLLLPIRCFSWAMGLKRRPAG